jgi:hypothetical protein
MPSRTWRSALAALLLALTLPPAAAAQGTGQIAGRVLDSQSGRPLAAARVAVQGTQLAALTTVDGRYSLRNVPAGEHALTVSLIGYAPKTVTGVRVAAGGVASVDVTLAPQGIQLGGITATATRERGSVSRALDEQRTATGIVNATTREQIARSPDADAARAVQRVSGVTVQDGKFVFVRGLGERYTTTSLNGARIPSPDPEKKVVPLDLFPSNLLESITTSKTFTPDQAGDFSGASVNLRTRQFPTRRTLTFTATGGYVAGGTGALLFPGSGADWWGNRAAQRALPPVVGSVRDFQTLRQGDINLLVGSFRNQWSPAAGSLPPNFSSALTLGGEERLLGQRLGYVGAFTYTRSQELRRGEERSLAVPDASNEAIPFNTFRGESGNTGVLWGGILNLTTFLGTGTKIELDNSYDRATDSEAHVDWGSLEEFQQIDSVRRSSLQYVERTVRSNQLRGEHALFGGARFDWTLTASRVTRSQPDRTDLLYGREQDVVHGGWYPLAWLGFLPYGARRSFMSLGENGREAQGNLTLPVGPSSAEARIRLGGAYRQTHRTADASAYDIRATGLTPGQRALPPEQIFDGRYTQPGDSLLTIDPNTQGGFYEARDHVAAGYLMGEWLFAGRVKVIGGARMERWSLDMDVQPTSSGLEHITRRQTDVLPSLAVNVALSDVQNLRLSATQTLARPEYRELAPVQYYSLAGDRPEAGDSSLQRTLVQNYDLRWELYPSAGEVLSFAAFAKHFDQPIERIEIAATGANLISYANAASAMNYGVEMELRRGLGFLSDRLDPFTFFTNATVMRSRIQLGGNTRSAATNPDRPMVGQAPYVVNAGLSYAAGDQGSASATLLYNVVGKRIWAAAQVPLRADAYEMPRHSLDLSLRLPVLRGMDAKLDASNLLDSPVEVKQGDVVRLRYRTGRTVSAGFTWRP